MIQLHPDILAFQTSNGDIIPCSAELVTVELIGHSASWIEPDLIKNAASAVLHYFKDELGRDVVSIPEFAEALEKVLKGLGFDVVTEEGEEPLPTATDLRTIAWESGKGFELAFFPRLRDELKSRLENEPEVLCLNGLRGCVKQLVGARRWSHRCQQLSDQIVAFVRHCMANELDATSCRVVIR